MARYRDLSDCPDKVDSGSGWRQMNPMTSDEQERRIGPTTRRPGARRSRRGKAVCRPSETLRAWASDLAPDWKSFHAKCRRASEPGQGSGMRVSSPTTGAFWRATGRTQKKSLSASEQGRRATHGLASDGCDRTSRLRFDFVDENGANRALFPLYSLDRSASRRRGSSCA